MLLPPEFPGGGTNGNGRTRWRRPWPTARSLGWLVEYLREAGVAPVPLPPAPRSWEEELAGRYRRYLVDERGLARKTVIARERTARLFLAEHRDRQLQDLDAGDISRFVTRQCRSLSARSAERLANGLRSFLRFALVERLITAPLAGAVPSVARWSGAGLPRGLAPGRVTALLASCDRGRATGRRDYAGAGSDRLIDALVYHGDAKTVAGQLHAHLDAGADHVAIQSLAPQAGDPMPGLRQLAGPLGLG